MNLRRTILLHLYEKGVYTDISNLIIKSFDSENDEVYIEIERTISQLTKDDFIRLTASDGVYHFGSTLADLKLEPNTSDKLDFALFKSRKMKIEARIQPLGIEKVEEWKLTESIRITNNTQRYSIYATIIIIFIGCVTQISTWCINRKQVSLQKEQMRRDSLWRNTDSLTIDGLMERTRSIQKQLDEYKKK